VSTPSSLADETTNRVHRPWRRGGLRPRGRREGRVEDALRPGL